MSDPLRCTECAGEVAPNAAFCSTCGAAIPSMPRRGAPFRLDDGDARPDRGETDRAIAETARLALELREALAPRYALLDRLGTGGMSTVFRAREEALRRLVAVKVLSPELATDPVSRERFEREARAAAALVHPNVVAVFGVGETSGRQLPYIIMQYVNGPTLADWMATAAPVGERTARLVLGELASALAAAHAIGIVHRDVKPSNVLIDAASGRAYMADFGVSVLRGQAATLDEIRVTATGIVVGTPVYMSPEQAAGDAVTDRSDVYSLGMVGYELLSGELPFRANSAMGWAAAHLRDMPMSLTAKRRDVSPEVGQIIDRCLIKEPASRPSAGDVATALAPRLDSEVEWPPPGLAPLRGGGRRLMLASSIVAAGAVVATLAFRFPPAGLQAGPEWWRAYGLDVNVAGSALGVLREPGRATIALTSWMWQAALMASVVVFTVGGIAWVLQIARLLRMSAAARQFGWHWHTLADVFVDPDGRSGLILSGAREFAAIDPGRRGAIIRWRRTQVVTVLGATAWIAIGLTAWAVTVATGLHRLHGAAPLMVPSAALTLLAPLMFAVLATRRARRQESQCLFPLPRRRAHASTSTTMAPNERASDVTSWYTVLSRAMSEMPENERPESAPVAHENRTSTGAADSVGRWVDRVVHARRAVVAVLLLSIGVAGLCVAGLAAAALIGARLLEQFGPETARIATQLLRTGAADPLALARSAWRPYLPQGDTAASRDAARLIRALASSENAYDTSLARLLPRGTGRFFGNAALPSDSESFYLAVAEHSRTTWFRQLATVVDADLLGAMTNRAIDNYATFSELPEPPFTALRSAAQANLIGARLAFARGAPDEAAVRLGENAAVAEHFLRVPRRFANEFGVGLLQDVALLPLAELEEFRGHAQQAVALRNAAATVRGLAMDPLWQSRLIGMAAAPEDLPLFALGLRNVRLPPGYRVESFAGAWTGFCLNAREIASGMDSTRTAVMLKAAETMLDVRGAPALARLAARTWAPAADLERARRAWWASALLTRATVCARMLS